MLSATLFENMISNNRADGAANDKSDDNASDNPVPLWLLFAFPEWPHTYSIIADRHCV